MRTKIKKRLNSTVVLYTPDVEQKGHLQRNTTDGSNMTRIHNNTHAASKKKGCYLKRLLSFF
jgi:hypothetical protein